MSSHLADPRRAPSIHVRAALTWLAIFPLVSLGLVLLGAFADGWHPVLRALVLTLVIIPLAVYVIVPRLLAVYVRVSDRQRRRRDEAPLIESSK